MIQGMLRYPLIKENYCRIQNMIEGMFLNQGVLEGFEPKSRSTLSTLNPLP